MRRFLLVPVDFVPQKRPVWWFLCGFNLVQLGSTLAECLMQKPWLCWHLVFTITNLLKWQVSCFVTRLVIGFCFSLLILDLWLKFHCCQISNGRFKPMYHGQFASYKVCMRIKTATCWWRATSKSLDWRPPAAYRDFSFLSPWRRCPDFAYGSEWLHR